MAVGLISCVLAVGAKSQLGFAQTCNQRSRQNRPIQLGVSGGNINDLIPNVECSGGTLGSLVQNKNSKQFILSNNHVLADVNKAKPGQPIVQPALLDAQCAQNSGDAVATFSRAVPIKFGGAQNVVDAALAEVKPGQVSSNILNIGAIAGSTIRPKLGLAVQKMGRTTCLTTGMITAVGVNSQVRTPKVAKFKNQIAIKVQDFSMGGDSGSLIVTTENCPQAVGLLFAGSDDNSMTLANPINPVLTKLNVSMVGGCTPSAASDGEQSTELAARIGISADAVASATAIRNRHEDELMNIPGAVGTGIGIGDEPGQAAIEVYVKKLTPQVQAATPESAESMQVKVIATGAFGAL